MRVNLGLVVANLIERARRRTAPVHQMPRRPRSLLASGNASVIARRLSDCAGRLPLVLAEVGCRRRRKRLSSAF